MEHIQNAFIVVYAPITVLLQISARGARVVWRSSALAWLQSGPTPKTQITAHFVVLSKLTGTQKTIATSLVSGELAARAIS